MELDLQTIFMFVLGLGVGLIGWIARQLFSAVQALGATVQKLELDLSRNYVSKTDWSAALDQINRKLDRIADKLEEKVDKK